MTPSLHTRSHRPGRLAFLLVAVGIAVLVLLPTAGAAPTAKSTIKVPGAGKIAAKAKAHYPRTYTLTNDKVGHWAVVVRPVAAHRSPNAKSPVVTNLSMVTGDGTQNLVLILSGIDVSSSQTWYRVRLAILPNNSTGWVPRSALGNVYQVNTHLYVNRETKTATLKRNGVTIFTTKVGVGRSYWPTPAGQFYVRDKLTNFDNPFYGPVAFGTSARSAVLTDWPGGGFIGVHGTNEPGIIPGQVSHGCVRVVNSQLLKLAKLLRVGSPVTIT